MVCKDSLKTYGCGTRFIHALILLLIFFQLLLGVLMGNFSNPAWNPVAYTLHKSNGMVILVLGVFFVFWRWSNQRPEWPSTMKLWEQRTAHAIHTLLYWLIILMPLSGWMLSTAFGAPPNFYWLFNLPFPLIDHDNTLASVMVIFHLVFAYWISALIAIHILGAFKHYFVDKDKILQRIFWGGRKNKSRS